VIMLRLSCNVRALGIGWTVDGLMHVACQLASLSKTARPAAPVRVCSDSPTWRYVPVPLHVAEACLWRALQ
jgi:hypothetical protein